MKLQGKTAVITGAASGIGRATSLLFGREGATVLCTDIDSQMGEETADMIRKEGGSAAFFQADLAIPSDIERMARQCMAHSDKIHVLFNNAGIVVRDTMGTVKLEDWNRILAVNTTAPYLCSDYLLPALKAANGASIIHNGSIDGIQGNPTVLSYSVSKGGLIPLTHIMAHALGKFKIRVNCINSGAISGSSQGIPIRLTEESRRGAPMSERQRKVTPLGRAGLVEEFAPLVLFLASDDSTYMTGSILTLDGGRTGLTPGTFD